MHAYNVYVHNHHKKKINVLININTLNLVLPQQT